MIPSGPVANARQEPTVLAEVRSTVPVAPAVESKEYPGWEEDFSPTFEKQLENEMGLIDGFQGTSETSSPPSNGTSHCHLLERVLVLLIIFCARASASGEKLASYKGL